MKLSGIENILSDIRLNESINPETGEMVDEGLKQARKNVGASKCWDGMKAKGTKMKNGKEVPNCVPEDFDFLMDDWVDEFTEEELVDLFVEALQEAQEDGFVVEDFVALFDDEEFLMERMDPKEIQRRRDQAKDRLATGAAMKKAAASSKSTPASRAAKVKGAMKKAVVSSRKQVLLSRKVSKQQVSLLFLPQVRLLEPIRVLKKQQESKQNVLRCRRLLLRRKMMTELVANLIVC